MTVSKGKVRSTSNKDKELGDLIRARRLEANLSQEKLGKKLGVTFQQVQKYEKGTNRVSVTRLMQIAEALGESIDYFVGEQTPRTSEITSMIVDHVSQRVVRAMAKIEDSTMRHRIAALVESIAGA